MTLVIAIAGLLGLLLWLNRRFARRRRAAYHYAAPVIPGDDALAAYCEQYIVCDDDVETVCDDYQDDAETCSDNRQDSGTTSDRNDE